jgi:DNA-binding transcriptional LysR family regulator
MKVDLNLFTVFEAIYREGNLTKAANALHITQPAISHSLAKLRESFDDPLFVRQGHKMIATPLAKRLISDVRQALSTLNNTLNEPLNFDARHAKRNFHIGLRDVLESTCLPPLLAHLQEVAPHISITSVRHDRKLMENDLASGQLDFVIDVVLPVSQQLNRQSLTSDHLSVLARKHHPRIKTVLDIETYLEERHVMASYRSTGMALEDMELNRYGLTRNIALRCQHYFAASRVVADSDLLLTMPGAYAQILAQQSDKLQVQSFPLESPAVDIHMYWHQNRDTEPELVWLRTQLTNLFT